MRIALAQINPIVGDIAGNTLRIRQAIDQAGREHAELVLFPELAVIGYPPKDLLLKPAVIDECVMAVNDLASGCTDIAAIIGYPCPSDSTTSGRPGSFRPCRRNLYPMRCNRLRTSISGFVSLPRIRPMFQLRRSRLNLSRPVIPQLR